MSRRGLLAVALLVVCLAPIVATTVDASSGAVSETETQTAPSGTETTERDARSETPTRTPDTASTPVSGTEQDSDGDGLSDRAERNTYGTNPNEADTDGDGVNDGTEIERGNDASSTGGTTNQILPAISEDFSVFADGFSFIQFAVVFCFGALAGSSVTYLLTRR